MRVGINGAVLAHKLRGSGGENDLLDKRWQSCDFYAAAFFLSICSILLPFSFLLPSRSSGGPSQCINSSASAQFYATLGVAGYQLLTFLWCILLQTLLRRDDPEEEVEEEGEEEGEGSAEGDIERGAGSTPSSSQARIPLRRSQRQLLESLPQYLIKATGGGISDDEVGRGSFSFSSSPPPLPIPSPSRASSSSSSSTAVKQESGAASHSSAHSAPAGSLELSESCCSICIEDWVIGNKLVELPCNHIFHINCLARWISVNSSCPKCRRSLA